MKVSIKCLKDGKWAGIPVGEIAGKSVMDYMLATFQPIVACLYEGEKAIAFLSNDDKYVEMYKHKGLSLHASTLKILMGELPMMDALEAVFSDGEIIEIRRINENVFPVPVVQGED